MQIPYGFFIVLSGIVLGIRGPVAAGILLGFVGMAVLLCARASLSAWKLGRPSTAYTVMSTMATSYLTWVFGTLHDSDAFYSQSCCVCCTML